MSDNTSNHENITPSEGEPKNNIQNSGENSINNSENPENEGSSGKVLVPENPEKQPEAAEDIPKKPITKIPDRENSNYQISLINQNLLKVNVFTKHGVKINSTVTERKTSAETQNNEIYLFPKFDNSVQEINVMISIDADEIKTEKINFESETVKDIQETIKETETESRETSESFPKSNYQINLINENSNNMPPLFIARAGLDSSIINESIDRFITGQSKILFN